MGIKHHLTLKSVTSEINIIGSILVVFCLLFISAPSFAATFYMAVNGDNSNEGTSLRPWRTLQYSFSQMSSGDTLIIGNGTYSGSENVVNGQTSCYPPSGSANKYTTIQAETDGSVIISGRCLITDTLSYVKLKGLVWASDGSSDSITVSSVNPISHIIFKNCGTYSTEDISTSDDNGGFYIKTSQYVLLEDCYAWGNFRYAFYMSGGAEYTIFRRCVSRIDAYNSKTLISNFMIYDAANAEIQNCIAIDTDSDASYFSGGASNRPRGFTTRSTGGLKNIYFRGCMAINISAGEAFYSEGSGRNINWENSVYWDTGYGYRSRGGGVTINHATFGKVIDPSDSNAPGFYSESGTESITNSIIYGIAYRGIQNAKSDYNSLHSNNIDYYGTSAGPNDYSESNSNEIDPVNGSGALKYLVKVECGSTLDDAASDSGDIGATILNKIGYDGVLYGDTGYNITTSNSLWPFPNENLIREKMRTYSYDSGNLSGKRGFCADGKTLTNYIWGYLGNTLPPFKVSANGGKSKVYLSWLPNKYDAGVTGYKIYMKTGSGKYTQIKQAVDNGFDTGRETYRSAMIDNLTNGVDYKFVIRTVASGGESGDSYEVSATPGPNPPAPPKP